MQSHLVKHTDIVPSLSTSVRVVVVVVKLWTHTTQTRLAHASRTARAHVSRWWHPCRTARTRHVRGVSRSLNRFSIVDLGHSSDSSTSQSRILVAVAPAVDGSLNQTSFSSQTRVQLSQSPTNSVAFSLVDQAISTVLILTAASSWINAVLGFEFRAQSVNIDRLHVASDGVLHLDTVARIFKCDPLNTIVVLSNHQRSSCWNGSWSCIWVDTCASTGNIVLIHVGLSIAWMLLCWGT